MTLKEIAGLSDIQLAKVYFRKRDKYGKLKRGKGRNDEQHWGKLKRVCCAKTKAWQETSFTGAFKKVWKDRGLTDEEVKAKWVEYVNLPKNRTLKEIFLRNEQVRNGFNGRRS